MNATHILKSLYNIKRPLFHRELIDEIEERAGLKWRVTSQPPVYTPEDKDETSLSQELGSLRNSSLPKKPQLPRLV